MTLFDSKNYWQEEAEDLSRALAALMRHIGVEHIQCENWNIYIASGWGADAIEVDENGQRVNRSPVWIDAFEAGINNSKGDDDVRTAI